MPKLRRTLVLASAASALLLAGCSAAPATTTPAPGPAVTSSPASPDTSPSASPSPTATACPSGEYTVTSFNATGKDGSLGKGTGGDIGVEFDNGAYEVTFDEDSPISLTIASGTGELIVDGSIEGTYKGTDDDMTFTLGKVKGTAKTRYQGDTRTVPMKQVASILGLSGSGSATCTGDNLSLKVGKTSFEMVRDH